MTQTPKPAFGPPFSYFSRTSFISYPDTFQFRTSRFASASQKLPCMPWKIPSIYLSCGRLWLTRVAGSPMWPSTDLIVLPLSRISKGPRKSGLLM